MTPPTQTAPTHDEIAQHARHLWLDRGCPTQRDTEIWLAAEQELRSPPPAATAPKPDVFAARALKVTADENLAGYQLPPAASVQEAITQALQKKDARTPQAPHHTGPKAKPAESGKPIWNKPHSS